MTKLVHYLPVWREEARLLRRGGVSGAEKVGNTGGGGGGGGMHGMRGG